MAALPDALACGSSDSGSDGDDEVFFTNRHSNFLDAQWYQQLLSGAAEPPSSTQGHATAETQTMAADTHQTWGGSAACTSDDAGVPAGISCGTLQAGRTDTASQQQVFIDASQLESNAGDAERSSRGDGSSTTTSSSCNTGETPASQLSSGASTADTAADACVNGSSGDSGCKGGGLLSLEGFLADDDLDDLLRRLKEGTAQLGGDVAVAPQGVSPFAGAAQLMSPRPWSSSKDATVAADIPGHPYVPRWAKKQAPVNSSSPSDTHPKLAAWRPELQQGVAVLVRPTVVVDLRQHSSNSNGDACAAGGRAMAGTGETDRAVGVASAAKPATAAAAAGTVPGRPLHRQQQSPGLDDSESDDDEWWTMRQQLRKATLASTDINIVPAAAAGTRAMAV